jgi:hypothetical protein
MFANVSESTGEEGDLNKVQNLEKEKHICKAKTTKSSNASSMYANRF